MCSISYGSLVESSGIYQLIVNCPESPEKRLDIVFPHAFQGALQVIRKVTSDVPLLCLCRSQFRSSLCDLLKDLPNILLEVNCFGIGLLDILRSVSGRPMN